MLVRMNITTNLLKTSSARKQSGLPRALGAELVYRLTEQSEERSWDPIAICIVKLQSSRATYQLIVEGGQLVVSKNGHLHDPSMQECKLLIE
jgi:hypothetical protein